MRGLAGRALFAGGSLTYNLWPEVGLMKGRLLALVCMGASALNGTTAGMHTAGFLETHGPAHSATSNAMACLVDKIMTIETP